jgi:hypothetical protein
MHNERMTFPSRADTEARLAELVEGTLTPEEAADWARPFVVDESTHSDSMDWPVWQALKHLLGADLLSTPSEYLHGRDDYVNWLTEFRRAVPDGR